MELDVAIVGAGLFGSIVAKALGRAGRTVTMVDNAQPEAGSLPAACLMKPGWYTSLGKAVYDPSLALLDELYGVQELQFSIGPLNTKVFWVPPSAILNNSPVRATVKKVTARGNGWRLTLSAGDQIEARTVIVAAGVWSSLLVPEVVQKGWAGMAFLWPKATIDAPFVKVWAPYKQIVGFNRGDGVWVGDGQAILRQNWTDDYAVRSEKRCTAEFSVPKKEPKKLFGIRPYHEAKPCLLQEVRPGLWVASGGAKNGTLAAGWCAHELLRRTQ